MLFLRLALAGTLACMYSMTARLGGSGLVPLSELPRADAGAGKAKIAATFFWEMVSNSGLVLVYSKRYDFNQVLTCADPVKGEAVASKWPKVPLLQQIQTTARCVLDTLEIQARNEIPAVRLRPNIF